MNQDINVKVEWDNKVITILTGQALEEKAPEVIAISGILSAPGQFLDKKKGEENGLFVPKNCHLLVDRKGMQLTFNINDKNAYGDQVIGKLEISKVLNDFEINGKKIWEVKELVKFLTTVKYWFETRSDADAMINALRNFSAQIKTKIEQKNNNSGNITDLYETSVQGAALPKFKLSIPVFEGYERKVFVVEIGIDPSDAKIRYFLISDDLFEIIQNEKERLFNAEIEKFQQWGCAVVFVS